MADLILPDDLKPQAPQAAPPSQGTNYDPATDPVINAVPPTNPIIGENPSPPVQTQSKPQDLVLPKDLTPGTQEHTSRLEALGKGFTMGLDTIASSLTKLTVKMAPSLFDLKPEDLQRQYVKEYKEYQADPATNAHPYIAGAGNIAGTLLATAPAAILGGSAVGALGAGAAADAGLGAGIQGAANLAGNVLGNSIAGGVTSGLMNSPTQGTNAWNPEAAKTGLEFGAGATIAGSALGKVLGTGSQIADMQSSKQALQTIGAKSSRMASDIEGGVSKWFANNVLAQLPFSGRAAQGHQVGEDFVNYFNALAPGTQDLSRTKIANTLIKHADDLSNMVKPETTNLTAEGRKAFQNVLSLTKQDLDPRFNPDVVGKIQQLNADKMSMGKFLGWALNPNTASNDVKGVSEVIGKEGTDELSRYGLRDLVQGSLDTKIVNGQTTSTLNLGQFMQKYNSLPLTSQRFIHKDTMDALSGLQQVASDYFQAVGTKQALPGALAIGAGATSIAGAGYMAYEHPKSTAASLIGLGTLALISRYAPLKNVLVNVNKLSESAGADPQIVQHVMTKAKDQLIRAGVVAHQLPDSSQVLYINQEQK